MPLLNIIIVLIIAGVALHLINRYIPMASSIKSILNVRGGSLRLRMAVAGHRIVGECHQFPAAPITSL